MVRAVSARDVACPTCKAPAGSTCRTLDPSRTPTQFHPARTREAHAGEAPAEHVDGQLALFGVEQAGPVVFVCARRRRSR